MIPDYLKYSYTTITPTGSYVSAERYAELLELAKEMDRKLDPPPLSERYREAFKFTLNNLGPYREITEEVLEALCRLESLER